MNNQIGFLFDLDGVITDTAKFHFQAWTNLAASIGIDLPAFFNEELKGISRMDSLDRILSYGKKIDNFSNEEKQKLATQKNGEYVKSLDALTPNDILPGVMPFLTQTKTLKIPCAIASASFNAPYILEKLGISSFFSFTVDPGTLRKGKPDPEIFIKAAEGIGVEPKNAIGFEDSQAGIESIKGAGAYAVGVGTESILIGADIQVAQLDELNIKNFLNEE